MLTYSYYRRDNLLMKTFELAREFVYRNARPLDLARWQYHFEGGSREAVLHALSYYQNPDGGFGHGLESDFLNPNSTPIATWAATQILQEVDLQDKNHPLLKGILSYLESGADFCTKQNQWLNTVPTNNDYPHATWWTYSGESDQRYNPTASLAGFIIKYADRDSTLFQKGCEIAHQAVEWFFDNVPFQESHITACFVQLYEYLSESDYLENIFTETAADRGITLDSFREKLRSHVHENICHDKDLWAVKYTSKPSDYFNSPESVFYTDNAETAKAELDFIVNSQLCDGSYPVTWQWWTEYKEFEISANRWKCIFAVNNMRYLKNFGVI